MDKGQKAAFDLSLIQSALGVPTVYDMLDNYKFEKQFELPKVEPGTDPSLLKVPSHMINPTQSKRSKRRNRRKF